MLIFINLNYFGWREREKERELMNFGVCFGLANNHKSQYVGTIEFTESHQNNLGTKLDQLKFMDGIFHICHFQQFRLWTTNQLIKLLVK
jgi:hypothetical protein